MAAVGLIMLVVACQGEWTGLIEGRLARGKNPRLEDFVFEGQWHAAVLSAALCLVLAVTARWWLPAPSAGSERPTVGVRPSVRWFWPAWLALVVLAGFIRFPRLGHSLYNDEAYMFRRYVAGEHKRLPDGAREWRPVSWLGTLWGNQMANNGVPYSLASRAAYDFSVARGWAAATLPAEVPLRLPAFLAGLGSVGVIALLARRLGGAGAGVAAAWLAAVHPWHVRYSTEARAHSFVLLLAPLLPLALARAVESGRGRWWVVFAATEVLLLWSFAGAVHYLLAFNFLALVWLWRRGGGAWRTFLAVHVLAALVYLHLMAPCFPQMRQALAENAVFSSGLGRSWAVTTGSFLLAGMPWENANPELASHPSLGGLWDRHPATVVLLLIAAAGLLAAGVRRAWSDPAGRLLALTLPLAAALAVAATLAGGTVLFTWYVLYLLPGGLVLAAAGLASLASLARRRGRGAAWAGGLVLGLACALWLTVIASPLATYRKMGKQALREVARAVRVPINGVVPLAALHRSEASAYDPLLISLQTDHDALRALIAQSDAEGRPLLVAFGYRDLMVRHSPDFLQAIEKSGEFERVAHFPGLEEPQFAQHIWRHWPRPPAVP